MKYLLLLASIAVSSAFAAENQSTLCTFGDKERKVEVVYPTAGGKACEVQYTKGTNMQVLWSANSDLSYCEERAAAFVEKQQGWGWQCESTAAAMTSEPVAEEMAEEVTEAAETMSEEVTEAAETIVEKVEEAAEEMK